MTKLNNYNHREEMLILTINMEVSMIKELNELCGPKGQYISMSEIARIAIRDFLYRYLLNEDRKKGSFNRWIEKEKEKEKERKLRAALKQVKVGDKIYNLKTKEVKS